MVRRLASSFLAEHGPTKTILQPLCSFFCKRAVKTIGVSAIEIYGASVGNSFFAITDHDGQQEVAINGCSSGTARIKSLASSMVHRSAPIATSTTLSKPSCFMAAVNFSGVIAGPNWPTNAGASAA